MIITGTDSPRYKAWQARQNASRHNGAYYYAKEIEDFILPGISHLPVYINTVGALLYKRTEIPAKSIVVCHDNVTTLKTYKPLFGQDILWICSKESVAEQLNSIGEKTAYIPLSVDVDYVKQFRTKKTKDTAFVGNAWGFKKKYLSSLPKDITQLNGMSRDDLLREMSKYKNIIAEGRCLIEAKILGAKCSRPNYEGLGVDIIDREIIGTKDVISDWHKVIKDYANKTKGYAILRSKKVFRDLTINKNRRIGDIFTVGSKRAKELLENRYNIVERLL